MTDDHRMRENRENTKLPSTEMRKPGCGMFRWEEDVRLSIQIRMYLRHPDEVINCYINNTPNHAGVQQQPFYDFS